MTNVTRAVTNRRLPPLIASIIHDQQIRKSVIGFAVLFSRSCTYAIRALTYLAMQPPGKLCGTREISKTERIPRPFLGKLLLELRRGRLLRSHKGIGGGYQLAQPPDRINLRMIVQCIEGDIALAQCILDDQECPGEPPCALHESAANFRDQFKQLLETKTLAELVRSRENKLQTPLQVTTAPDRTDQRT